MLQTMPDRGEWSVHVGPWNWVYVFSKDGTVTWKDPRNGLNGRGTWKVDKNHNPLSEFPDLGRNGIYR